MEKAHAIAITFEVLTLAGLLWARKYEQRESEVSTDPKDTPGLQAFEQRVSGKQIRVKPFGKVWKKLQALNRRGNQISGARQK